MKRSVIGLITAMTVTASVGQAANVNTPPPKGGGFKLRLKAGSVRLSADLGNREVVVRFGWRLVLDVFDPNLISDVSTAGNPVSPGPEVLAPIPLAQDAEFAQQFV